MNLIEIKEEINRELANKETFQALVSTTFKGLEPMNVKKAIFEAMVRGYSFKDFLEKNIYAIPYGNAYSLVTSVDHARKVGMRSGIVGKLPPVFTMNGAQVESCTVTVKRKVEDYVGDYSATVFFEEYNTGKNLWQKKPRTMLAKVAEMHALRMACPEELSQSYIEEEVAQKEEPVIDITDYKAKLEACKNMDEVKAVWSSMPGQAKLELEDIKNNLKQKYDNKDVPN